MDSDFENLMEGLACPHCGQSVAIDVEAQTNIRIDRQDIEILTGRFNLFEGCRAQCPDCKYTADFADFKLENQMDDSPTTHPAFHSQRFH